MDQATGDLLPAADVRSDAAVDWSFLQRQCFGDRTLEAELLALYMASTSELVAALPLMQPSAQDAAAHRLKGASQGVGAWAMARAAAALEAAAPELRRGAAAALASAFADVERAVRERGRAG